MCVCNSVGALILRKLVLELVVIIPKLLKLHLQLRVLGFGRVGEFVEALTRQDIAVD